MINTVEEYVRKLPHSELQLIINGYEKLHKQGAVGDEPIRLHAQALLRSMGTGEEHIVIWMQHLAFETYKLYAGMWFSLLTCVQCNHPDKDRCAGGDMFMMCACKKCHPESL